LLTKKERKKDRKKQRNRSKTNIPVPRSIGNGVIIKTMKYQEVSSLWILSGSEIIGKLALCFVRWRFVERQSDGDDSGNTENDEKRILVSFPGESEERWWRLLWNYVDAVLLNS